MGCCTAVSPTTSSYTRRIRCTIISVSYTHLDVYKRQGQTFAEIIEANGGDVTAVTAQLIESLQDSPMLQDQDPEEFVTGLLNGSMNGRPGN